MVTDKEISQYLSLIDHVSTADEKNQRAANAKFAQLTVEQVQASIASLDPDFVEGEETEHKILSGISLACKPSGLFESEYITIYFKECVSCESWPDE